MGVTRVGGASRPPHSRSTARDTVRLIAPQDGEHVDCLAVFRWKPKTKALGYVLQVSDRPDFGPRLMDVAPISPYAPVVLPSVTECYWRVRVVGPDGADTWSDAWKAIVD
jgi:hypothetical protein